MGLGASSYCGVGGSGSCRDTGNGYVAPTALPIFLTRFPGLPAWANFCRAYGAGAAQGGGHTANDRDKALYSLARSHPPLHIMQSIICYTCDSERAWNA